MAKKKSTKKFEKNHLKKTIENRKEFAKIKQRNQVKEKKKVRRAKEEAATAASAVEDGAPTSRAAKKQQKDEKAREAFKDMTVDEFFAGGFEIADQGAKGGKHAKGVIGKRKRTAEEEGQQSSGSDDSLEEQPVLSDSDPESEADGEGEAHKGDLEALAQKDPEFYKYLQENDAELLEFDDNGEMAGFGELSAEEEEEEEPAKKKKKKGKGREEEPEVDNEVTLAMVERWQKSMMEQKSLRALKDVALAFRAAVRSNEDEEKEYKYSISSAEVYHRLLTITLRQIPEVVEHHIPTKTLSSGKVRIPTDGQKFKTLSPLLNSHAASLTYLLETLSDEKTLKLTLECINPLLPYFLTFRKSLKNLIRRIIDIWSAQSSSETTRINAFLLIRRLAVIGDQGMRETLLKAAYQGLVKGSRNTTVHTLAGINLMKNSAVDLWGTDYDLGYTTGFTYIRQLAIHLRTTLTHPTKDSYKAIYNWQYIHSLDFWSRVFSTHCSPASNTLLKQPTDCPLHPLIYPLVQVALGALRLIPTPTYFPLRFHLTRSLLRISRSTTTYIPLAPALLEVLQSPEVKDSPKPSTLKPLDFPTILRAPKGYSRTRTYQDGIMEQASDLLAEFFGAWAKSVAFPELIIPPTVLMKRWMKDVSSPNRHVPLAKDKKGKGKSKRPNPKITAPIALLIQKMNLNAEFIEKHRRKLEFAPKDREQLKSFLKDLPWEETPMGAFVEGIRKQREERERLLEKGRRDDEDRRRKEKREEEREMEEDVEMEDDEDISEDEESGSEGGVPIKGQKKQGVEKSKKGKAGLGKAEREESDEEMEDWEDEDDEEDEDDDGELFDAEEGPIEDEAVENDEDEEDDL
ncbi:Nucleolar Complex 2 protein [Thelotrema lepadinum]|nr:Nucleolar Complex 2 protein [Thelotrema lepadinum]